MWQKDEREQVTLAQYVAAHNVSFGCRSLPLVTSALKLTCSLEICRLRMTDRYYLGSRVYSSSPVKVLEGFTQFFTRMQASM